MSDEIGSLCSKGHDIVASLIPPLSAAVKTMQPTTSSNDMVDDELNTSNSSLMISNRALRSEVSLLKDSVMRLARQSAIDKAVTLQAQRTSHQSERLLHNHLANKTINLLPSDILSSTSSSTLLLTTPAHNNGSSDLTTHPSSSNIPCTPQPLSGDSRNNSANSDIAPPSHSINSSHDASNQINGGQFNGSIINGSIQEEASHVSDGCLIESLREECDTFSHLAELRLKQLERTRDELKKVQDDYSALLEKVCCVIHTHIFYAL